MPSPDSERVAVLVGQLALSGLRHYLHFNPSPLEARGALIFAPIRCRMDYKSSLPGRKMKLFCQSEISSANIALVAGAIRVDDNQLLTSALI